MAAAFPTVICAQTFSIVHNFSDTSTPEVRNLVQGPDGALYGTTVNGGTYGLGSIFKVFPDGSGFTNIYLFDSTSGTQPIQPYGGLVLSSNVLYGTTSAGGTGYLGTLFRVNTDGTDFTNLHNFPSSSYYPVLVIDGWTPYATLTLSGNTLYGTTQFGGSGSFGTVFKINTDGTGYQVLHNFGSDFGTSQGPLLSSGDMLYGTAFGNISSPGGVFKVDTNGNNFATVASVSGQLFCGLVLQSDTLYGTTEKGGTNGFGFVFSVKTNGQDFATLHSFNGTDGEIPEAGLVLLGNTLYGTTTVGGTNNEGVIFKINTDGSGFQDVYESSGTDGSDPQTDLLLSGGILYGGSSRQVFSLDPTDSSVPSAPSLAIQHNPGGLRLSWRSDSGYTLQQSTSLAAPNWTTFSGTVNDDGTNKSASLGSPAGRMFVRLSSQ